MGKKLHSAKHDLSLPLFYESAREPGREWALPEETGFLRMTGRFYFNVCSGPSLNLSANFIRRQLMQCLRIFSKRAVGLRPNMAAAFF